MLGSVVPMHHLPKLGWSEFCLTTERLLGGWLRGGLTPPPPSDPDFIVGKNEILQKEIFFWLFLVHKLLDF